MVIKWLCIVSFSILSLSLTAQTQIGSDIDGVVGDYSGWSVSMPDSVNVAIGSPFNGSGLPMSGAVRVYSLNGTGWLQKGSDILGEDVADNSGYSVNMPDSNTLAIGALNNGVNGSGYARVYSWDGSAWIQKGSTIYGVLNVQGFGTSVSMPDSNTIAIGATDNDPFNPGNGQVRIFTWNGTSWILKGAPIGGEALGDRFGSSVSMPDSNTIAIGAPNNSGNATGSGHARVYSWNGTSWIQKGIDLDGEAAGDQSGGSVSMPDSNTLAIGAEWNDGNGMDSGHTRVFEWNGSSWIQKGLDIDGEALDDHSGFSVSMPDNNTLAIGAIQNDGNGTDVGSVRVYNWGGSSWTQIGNDINGELSGDLSGFSVCMPNTLTVAIGATQNDGNGSESGHARIYSMCGTTSSIIVSVCDSYTSPSGNYIWNVSGMFQDTISNIAGCDSVITVFLTINNNTGTEYVTTCDSFTWIDGNTYTSSTNTPTWTLTNQAGCDSVVTLNLSVFANADTSVSQSGIQLISNQPPGGFQNPTMYQWVDCNNNYTFIPGETNQDFTPSQNGNYAVILTFAANGCSDTSACIPINTIGIIESEFTDLIVSPNPTEGEIYISLGNSHDNVSLRIYDATGRLVQEQYHEYTSKTNLLIDQPPGPYTLEIIADTKRAVVRIVKQ